MPVRKKTPIRKTKDRKNAVVTPRAPAIPSCRKPKSKIVKSPSLKTVVIDALADMKALEVKVLDVRGLTDIADCMVIASGTSDRHVRSVAQRVVERTKEAGFRPHGVEGQQDSDWVLIDLNEMIVHVMLPRVREFYGLEKLWDMTATKRAARAPMKCRLIAAGTRLPDWVNSGFLEYQKRLRTPLSLELHEIAVATRRAGGEPAARDTTGRNRHAGRARQRRLCRRARNRRQDPEHRAIERVARRAHEGWPTARAADRRPRRPMRRNASNGPIRAGRCRR